MKDKINEATARELVAAITKRLVDEGRLIEGGWVGLCAACMPIDASEVQHREMRRAFFAGAQHLFGSIMLMLDPTAEPTEKDMQRMMRIQNELGEFAKSVKTGLH